MGCPQLGTQWGVGLGRYTARVLNKFESCPDYKIKVVKVYLVNREGGEYSFTTVLKAFSTLEKAKAYMEELEEKYKDNISFKFCHFYFEIEEIEVE